MWCAILAATAALIGVSNAARILYVAPVAAISHYQMLEPLMLRLAELGHEVTVLSHYPQQKKVANYTDVSLRGVVDPYELDFVAWSLIDDVLDSFRFGADGCERVVSSSVVQDFIKSDRKFDLIFLEAFDSDCYLGFVKRFRAPFILYSAMVLPVWESDWIYNPIESSYVPDCICRTRTEMGFFDRIQNVLCQFGLRMAYWHLNVRPSVDIVNKHFRTDVTTLEDIKKNVSMMFVNSFFGLHGARPFMPNIIELGGIHMKPNKPLPPVSVKIGLVYFAMS